MSEALIAGASSGKNYNRKLTAVEEELEFYNQQLNTLNVATVIKVCGTLSIDTICSALELLQKRHPFLQVNIVNCEDGLYFSHKKNRRIPLRVVKKNKDLRWQEILEEELNCQIDSQHNCLLRVTYITSSENNISELIFLINHAICDGVSFLNLCHTFLKYCEQIIKGKEVKIKSLTMMPTVESLLPIKNNLSLKSKRLFSIINLILNQVIKKPHLLKKEISCPVSQQNTLSIHRSLRRSKTLQLIQICKQEKTTVTGALNAAMLMALKNNIILTNKTNNIYINGVIPINLRKLIQSELAAPENLGFLVGSPLISFYLPQSKSFWDLARESRQKIEFFLQKERPFQSLFLAKERINLAKQKKEFPASFILSNLGKINLKETYGNLELHEVRTTTSLRGYNPVIMSHFTTFRDSLHITFSYANPLISSQKVEKIMDCFISIIEQAISTRKTILGQDIK